MELWFKTLLLKLFVMKRPALKKNPMFQINTLIKCNKNELLEK